MIESQLGIRNCDFPFPNNLFPPMDRACIHVDLTDSNVTWTALSVTRPAVRRATVDVQGTLMAYQKCEILFAMSIASSVCPTSLRN
jgi:hypothetical protein